MCGITGFIKYRGGVEPNYRAIDGMLDLIKHRGPDDMGVCGISIDRELIPADSTQELTGEMLGILGFNRLSIQDLTAAGHQPMLSPDKNVVLTFNGEIYNVDELRTTLRSKGHVFIGKSDTEVLLHLYLECGFYDAIKMLNGIFAIVLYDKRKNELYIARDRFGIIPLYVIRTEERLLWASEIKCFMKFPGFERQLDRQFLNESFMYSFPATPMYKGVEAIEPGTIWELSVIKGTIDITKFFDINGYHIVNRSFDDALEEADEILRRCVKRQLISDVNVGVQFSGGVDSTLVAKYASEFKSPSKSLYAFSMINSDADEISEEKWIDHAASKLPIDLCKIDLDLPTFIHGLEQCTWAYEKFVNTPSAIGIYNFSRVAKNKVTVLLSGEGADELTGGYLEYIPYKTAEMFSRTGKWESGLFCEQPDEKEIVKFVREIKRGRIDEHCNMMLEEYEPDETINKRLKVYNGFTGSFFDKYRKYLFRYHLVGLLERQNKICMANSVENRVPIIDNEFADFAFSLPEDIFFHLNSEELKDAENGKRKGCFTGKYILKKLSANFYGHEFAFHKKQTMQVPLMKYMQSDMFREYVNGQIWPGLKTRGIINVSNFEAMYNNMTERNIMSIWYCINSEIWCQLFIDGRKPLW